MSALSTELEALWGAPVGLAILDLDLRYVRVNDALAALHGLGAAEHVGKTVLEVLPLQGPELAAPLLRVRDGGAAEAVEVAGHAPLQPGVRCHWRVSCHPIHEQGRVTGVAATVVDISAQRSAERALEQADERLRASLTATDIGLWHWDPERDAVVGDRNFLRLFGLEAQDDVFSLAPCLERIHAEDRPRVEAASARALASGGLYDEVYRVVQAEHGQRWLHARGLVTLRTDGKPASFPGILLDVTRRVEASERLRESGERYRALLDSIDDGFCLIDVLFDAAGERAVDYRFVELNASFARQTGLVDAAGKTARALVPALDEFWYETYGRVARTGEATRFERDEPAMRRVLEVQAMRVGAPERRRVALLFRDITARAQSEAALKRSETRFKRLFATNLLGILFWDLEGGVSDANDEFLRMVGYSRAELDPGAIDWVRMTPSEHRAQDERAVESLRRTGKHAPIEKEYLCKDGSRVWVLVGSAIIAGDAGVGFVLDISRQKQTEAALRGLNERLEEADRRKDEFIATLAHELRNPLAPVRNAVHILKRIGPAEPRLERARDVIDRQVTHMARLIDDLLDVSRITRGKLALQTETCDLAAIARQTAEDYRSTLDAAGLGLVTAPAGEPMWVEGDPIRLAQIVGNFLNNAGRFTEKGGEVELRAALDLRDRCAVIEVVDTGTGIEPGLLSRLFDPFSQANQDLARTKGGLGLGLALTKGLAELHGGGVTAHSDGPDLGARFTLRIPLSKSRYEIATQGDEQGSSGAQLRILVVEDNHDAAEMLGELLELGGHQVQLAADGLAGLAAAQTFHPDVVISDIGLPGEMDGYAVARSLRAAPGPGRIYLIALSGYADEAARKRSRDAGFDLHLAKPPDITLLERTLTAVVRR